MSKNLKSKNKKKTLRGRPTHFDANLKKGHPLHRWMGSKTAAGFRKPMMDPQETAFTLSCFTNAIVKMKIMETHEHACGTFLLRYRLYS